MVRKSPAGAPDPVDVVEALSSPTYAKFLDVALVEAADTLQDQWTNGGAEPLTPMKRLTVEAIKSLGAQLVTATTAIAGESAK